MTLVGKEHTDRSGVRGSFCDKVCEILTKRQKLRYQPHVSHVFHSALDQFARLNQAVSVMTVPEFDKQFTNSHKVLERTARCSLESVEYAFKADVNIGESSTGFSSTAT